jgi:16S rRNA (uracil1498-N3)-methyltransferase
MATLRVPLSRLAAGERELDAEQARYVSHVHRLGAGDRLLLFDPEARLEAEAQIVACGRAVRLRLDEPRPATLVAHRPVTVIQSLAKGTKVDDVVRDATELGATAVLVAEARRSVKRGGDAKRWRRVAVEAARQCGRGDVPTVEGPLALEALLGRGLGPGVLGLCLHPEGDRALGEALAAAPGAPITLLIGPEGGFCDEELAAARAAGYQLVALGPFVLRAETACAAALGAVLAQAI